MKRTKPPKFDTLPDGRILGKKTEDIIPETMRNVVPKYKPRSHGANRNHIRDISAMCRTRMPLALTPDGEVDIEDKKIRMKGINQAKYNAIMAGIRSGMTLRDASRLCGINEQTIQQWRKWGKMGKWPYTLIAESFNQAEAELERDLMEAIRQAGTLRLDYQEQVTEEITNEHGETTTKTKTSTKVRFPQWNAAAWILERTRPQSYRSDREIEGVDEPNIMAEIEAMKQISDVMEIREDGNSGTEESNG